MLGLMTNSVSHVFVTFFDHLELLVFIVFVALFYVVVCLGIIKVYVFAY